jgi:hypothetical protein
MDVVMANGKLKLIVTKDLSAELTHWHFDSFQAIWSKSWWDEGHHLISTRAGNRHCWNRSMLEERFLNETVSNPSSAEGPKIEKASFAREPVAKGISDMCRKNISITFFISLVLSVSAILSAQELNEAAIDGLIDRSMKAFDVPGISVGVIKDGKIVYAKGVGVRLAENDAENGCEYIGLYRLQHESFHHDGSRHFGRRRKDKMG